MVIQLARMNDSLVEDSFAKCVSQTISRQPDSDNLNIRIELVHQLQFSNVIHKLFTFFDKG